MLTFIPTPIGNIQDITFRAITLFEEAELFFCEDTRNTKHLLKLLEARMGMRYPDVEFVSFNEHNGQSRIDQYADVIAHKRVVYVSDAGMPVISDPGQLLVAYCQQQGIAYDVLPGASAVTTAYAASGFEEGKFLFYAFLPHKGKERATALHEVMANGYNTVLYEAPHRLEKLLAEITQIDSERELFLAKEISKQYQHYYRGCAGQLLEKLSQGTIRGEWVVIVRGEKTQEQTMTFSEVLQMDLPPKIKAKILSKLSDRSVKEWYEELIRS